MTGFALFETHIYNLLQSLQRHLNIHVKMIFVKKILLILVMIFGLGVGAEQLAGGVEWLEINQEARDEQIERFKPEAFGAQQRFGPKKDKDYRRHVMLVADGIKTTDKAELGAFYKGKVLIMYALRRYDEPRTAYYYSLLGKLYYVDKMSENYPNFPYTSRQYRANGKPVSYIYFPDRDTQYIYEPDGEFKGIWHKDKMYDRTGRQILTRTNW